MTHCLLYTILLLALVALPSCAEVRLVQADDRSVQVTTGVYTVRIDAKGNLSEMTVRGAKAFTHQFGDPGKPPLEAPSITVHNTLVAIRAGAMRVEWDFSDARIHAVTQGYNFESQLDPSLKAIVVPGGKGGSAQQMYGNSSALALANDLTVAYSIPFHAGAGRLVPTGYCNGANKPGDLLEFDFIIGAPVDAVQLLSALEVKGVGNSYGALLDGGNQGHGIVHFSDPTAIVLQTIQRNISAQPMSLMYDLVVRNHKVAGTPVAMLKQTATITANSSAALRWELPKLAPGFYYLTASVYRGETKLTATPLTFAVDLTHYSHPLTRPTDFTAFWERQNARLAATPMNPKMTLISVPENPNKAYDVLLDMPDGSTVHGCLVVPEKIGKGPAQFGSLMIGPLNDLMTKAKAPDFTPAKNVAFTIALPEEGTYTTWTDAENNNLLQCILVWLRGIDFLASRPEVNSQRIMVNGASRTGGLTLIAAALRPKNVCAANGFVHTSCGLSWEDKPYLGWGKCPNPKDPVAMKLFCQQAAYVDPVNFAPDVKCPTILAYGIDDVFSPPQGIEAAYHLLGANWKRISRDEGGHQYSAGCQNIQQQLTEYLDAGGTIGPDQSRTLTDH